MKKKIFVGVLALIAIFITIQAETDIKVQNVYINGNQENVNIKVYDDQTNELFAETTMYPTSHTMIWSNVAHNTLIPYHHYRCQVKQGQRYSETDHFIAPEYGSYLMIILTLEGGFEIDNTIPNNY